MQPTFGTRALIAGGVIDLCLPFLANLGWLIEQFFCLEGEVQAVIVGWAGFTFSYFAKPIFERWLELNNTRNRAVKIMKDMIKEVEQTKNNLQKTFSREKKLIIEKIFLDPDTQKDYVPLISTVKSDPLFKRSMREIDVFNENLRDDILNYYEYDQLLDAMIQDTKTDRFSNRSLARKSRFINDIFDIADAQIAICSKIISNTTWYR